MTKPSPIPKYITQALCNPYWKIAMDSKIHVLLSNHTWDIFPRPPKMCALLSSGTWYIIPQPPSIDIVGYR